MTTDGDYGYLMQAASVSEDPFGVNQTPCQDRIEELDVNAAWWNARRAHAAREVGAASRRPDVDKPRDASQKRPAHTNKGHRKRLDESNNCRQPRSEAPNTRGLACVESDDW